MKLELSLGEFMFSRERIADCSTLQVMESTGLDVKGANDFLIRLGKKYELCVLECSPSKTGKGITVQQPIILNEDRYRMEQFSSDCGMDLGQPLVRLCLPYEWIIVKLIKYYQEQEGRKVLATDYESGLEYTL